MTLDLKDFRKEVGANPNAAGHLEKYLQQKEDDKELRGEIATALNMQGREDQINPQDRVILEQLAQAYAIRQDIARDNYFTNQERWLGEIEDSKLVQIAISVEPVDKKDSHYKLHRNAREVSSDLNPRGEKYAENIVKYSKMYIEEVMKEETSDAVKSAEKQLGKLRKDEFYKNMTEEQAKAYAAVAENVAKHLAIQKLKSEGALESPEKAAELYKARVMKKFQDSFGEEDREKAIATYVRDNIRVADRADAKGIDRAIGYLTLIE